MAVGRCCCGGQAAVSPPTPDPPTVAGTTGHWQVGGADFFSQYYPSPAGPGVDRGPVVVGWTHYVVTDTSTIKTSAYLRFQVNHPQGTLFSDARLDIQNLYQAEAHYAPLGAVNGTTAKWIWRCEASDNAVSGFPTAAYLDGRPRTTAAIVDSIDVNDYSANSSWKSINISSCINEVVARTGWVSGNFIRIFMDEDNGDHAGNDGVAFFPSEASPSEEPPLLTLTPA